MIPSSRPHVMSLEELARVEPIPVTGAEPPDIATMRERGRQLAAAPPVIDEERLAVQDLMRNTGELVTASHRPRWAAVEYLPRIVPHRVPVDPRRRRHWEMREPPPMRLLHQHNFEAMSQSYPWRCVGKVFTSTAMGPGPSGSGVLVWPESHDDREPRLALGAARPHHALLSGIPRWTPAADVVRHACPWYSVGSVAQ